MTLLHQWSSFTGKISDACGSHEKFCQESGLWQSHGPFWQKQTINNKSSSITHTTIVLFSDPYYHSQEVLAKYQNGHGCPKSCKILQNVSNASKMQAMLLLTCLLNRIAYCDKVKLRFWVIFWKSGISMWPFAVVVEHKNGNHWPKSHSINTKLGLGIDMSS